MPIRRGEIYFVNLNPITGREQGGERPVLVLSNDAINSLPLVITVVVGTKGENIPRDYLLRMFGFLLLIAAFRWKRFFYAFRYDLLIRQDFRNIRLAAFRKN